MQIAEYTSKLIDNIIIYHFQGEKIGLSVFSKWIKYKIRVFC